MIHSSFSSVVFYCCFYPQLLHISQDYRISCIFLNIPCFYHAFLLASQYTWNSLCSPSKCLTNNLKISLDVKITKKSPHQKQFLTTVLILLPVLLLYLVDNSFIAHVTINCNLFKCLVLYLNNPQKELSLLCILCLN